MDNGQKVYYNGYWTNDSWHPIAKLSTVLNHCFEDNIKPGQTLLDVGCGDGRHYGRALSERVREHIGLDVSVEALKLASQNGIKVNLWSGHGKMPFMDGSFDVAICIEVLEHLFEPEETLCEIYRVLKPGGTVIVTVPNIGYFRERLLLLKGTFNPGGSPLTAWDAPWRDPHIRFFTPKTLVGLFGKTHFHICQVAGDGGNPVGDLPLVAKLTKGRIIFPHIASFVQRRWPALWGSKTVLIAKKVA